LPKLSVKKPYTVVVAVVLVVILGIVSFTEMTPDLLPSIDLPYVIVMTSYPGASPETIEMSVTKPIEQSVATVNNVKNITSTSSENVSMVMMQFNDGTNMDSVSLDIRENIDMIKGYFPDEVSSPMILKLNPDMMPVAVAAIDVDGMELEEISRYADEKIIPAIEGVEGVAQVNASGLLSKQMNVVIQQEKIDKINEKLKKSVEEKLSDARKKLDEAEAEIKKGKNELEKKQDQYTAGMTEANQKLLDAKLEILKNEIKLVSSEEELKAKEEELKSQEKTLKDKETLLNNSYTKLNTSYTQVSAAKKELKPTYDSIVSKENKLKNEIESVEASIESTKNDNTLNESQKEELLEKYNVELSTAKIELQQLESSSKTFVDKYKALEKQESELKTQITALETAKKTVESGKQKVEEGKKALNTAKTQLETGKSGLKTGKDTLNNKEKELEKTQSTVGNQLSDASNQLTSGEKEITSQKDQFEESQKQAIEQAKVDDKITVDMITNILKAQNFSMPAGYITESGIDYMVRVGDKLEDQKELENLTLFDLDIKDMDPIKLSDVADVFWTDNSAETYAKINGNDGIILTMQKQTSYATGDVSDNIKAKFESLEDEEPALHVTTMMDQGMYIDIIVNSVLNNLVFGAILAIIVLLLFLKDIKPTFVIACSIPISVIFAIVLMYFSGVTLNIISLSGLAVGVGMLVDNSVVVIENIYRLRSKGESAAQAAVDGARQVAGAIIASTLTTVCVFLPIVFVKGITRQLFTDMALTIGYSLLASLIVALTVVPMMSANVLKNTKEKKHGLFDKFLSGYESVLQLALRGKILVIVLAIAILGGSVVGAMSNGTAFMPEMDSTQITLTMKMPEGKLLDETVEMSEEIVSRIQKIKDVDTVGAMLGSGNAMGLSMGDSSNDTVQMYIMLDENKKRKNNVIVSEIEEACEGLDCEVAVSGSTMDMSALGGSGVSVQIVGPELDVLKDLSKKAAEKLALVEGTEDVDDGIKNPAPEIRISVDKTKAILKGLTVAQIYTEVSNQISAAKDATTIMIDGNEYTVSVDTDKSSELKKKDLEKITFTTTDSEGKEKKVKLSKIATIIEETGFSSISREQQKRYVDVTASIKDGYNVGLVSKDVKKAFEKFDVPAGYEIHYKGESETINESMGELVKMLILAIAFIYLIMVAQFQSLLSPFIVLFTIPLAFTGGFLGLWFTGNEISVIGMIGFVMLSGIVVNNGIVLVDYTNQLRLAGMNKKDAIVEAAVTRMRPVLMTALTTILGLSTMAIGVGMGSEMMQPVAIVTIGGLLYATITTLFVIPVLYDVFHRREMKKLDIS